MFTAKAVFPIDGRAATMIRSDGCRPAVSSSRSVKPVADPVTEPALVALVQDLERILDRRAHRHEAFAPRAPASAIWNTLLLGGLEQFLDGPAFGPERIVGDLGAGVDQLPQHRFLAHDVGVRA